ISKCIEIYSYRMDDKIDNDCDGLVDEEIKNGKDDDNDGAIDEDLSRTSSNGCHHMWFGLHCDIRCHCLKSICTPDGNCPAGSHCEHGYFGHKCQYKDAVITAHVSNTEIKKRTDTKCKDHVAVNDSVRITLDRSIRFTWMQIEALNLVGKMRL
uniref:EGF-like domain-containing protein n=1 Tax=Biomphalaria glabrata TaxID=6526 RepID=A0A2C9M1S8_BIOGL